MNTKENDRLIGEDVLIEALTKLDIDLVSLVAETSIWVSPIVYEQLIKECGSATIFPYVRRGKRDEKRGDVIDNIRFDDNTYANIAIKNAVGLKKGEITGFDTCHIYPNTCYDERYHTHIANLVLIPSGIAQLSDSFDKVINTLKYRAFELYKWHPENEPEPIKPSKYPNKWKEPIYIDKIKISKNTLKKQDLEANEEADCQLYFDREKNEVEKIKSKVPNWFKKPDQINSIILIQYLELLGQNEFVSRENLKEQCASRIDKFDGNFNQMAHFGDRNNGKVFEVNRDDVRLWPPVATFIKGLYSTHKGSIDQN